MTETIPVIREAEALDEAEAMGRAHFADLPGDVADVADPAHVTDSAWWANHELPRLRAMSGYADRHGGTFTEVREVAVIPDGCEDDRPAEADVTTSDRLHEELVSAWFEGAYQAIDAVAETQEETA